MAKKPKDTNVFSDVAQSIKKERAQKSWVRISTASPKKIDAYYAPTTLLDAETNLIGVESTEFEIGCGASMTIGFDSVENLDRFIDAKLSPGTGAWRRISYLLRQAQSDQFIKNNSGAIEFLKMVEAVADNTIGGDTSDKVFKPLFDFSKSQQARKNAQSKNVKERNWVISQWEQRTDVKQSKAAFAKVHAALVKKKFDVLVTAETIYRDWLPKAK